VECDMHTDKVQRGLDRVILMDKIVQQTAARVKGDTLLLATADHSFDLRMPRGKRGVPLRLPGEVEEGAKADIEVFGSHTGEQVLVAAQGPGAERVKGFLVNTDLFGIMMKALGWQ
jgi:alkaline phosphatase